MSQLKEKVIANIIAVEGGYSNDPLDSGGKTMYGITKAVARAFGYKGKMRKMPRSIAEAIYSKRYWHALRLDGIEALSSLIAEEIADTSVNMGVGRAGRFLQRALNVLNDRQRLYKDIRVDGQIGAKTLHALQQYLLKRPQNGESVLFSMLNALQGAKYVELAERYEKNERFEHGWFLNRVA